MTFLKDLVQIYLNQFFLNFEIYIFVSIKIHFYGGNRILCNFSQIFAEVQTFCKFWWVHGKNCINIYQEQSYLIWNTYFRTYENELKILVPCYHYLAVFLIACDVSFTLSIFYSRCNFENDEDKNKYSLAPCEGIVKFRHTFLVIFEKKIQFNSRPGLEKEYRTKKELD